MNKISVVIRRDMKRLFISLPYEDTERKQLPVNKESPYQKSNSAGTLISDFHSPAL